MMEILDKDCDGCRARTYPGECQDCVNSDEKKED
jgi:hypothetical protein